MVDQVEASVSSGVAYLIRSLKRPAHLRWGVFKPGLRPETRTLLLHVDTSVTEADRNTSRPFPPPRKFPAGADRAPPAIRQLAVPVVALVGRRPDWIGLGVYVPFPDTSVEDGVAWLIAGGRVHYDTFQSLRTLRTLRLATDVDTIVTTSASVWAIPLEMSQLPLCAGVPWPSPAKPIQILQSWRRPQLGR